MRSKLFLTSTLLVLFVSQLASQQPQPAPQTPPQAAPAEAPVQVSNLFLQNTSLRTVIDQLAQQLHMNIMVDDKVQGNVTLNTYGQGTMDARNLLDLVLRINGAGLLQEGNIYRVVPTNELVAQPFYTASEAASIPEDERPMLNLIFLKYVTVDEVSKILAEFSDQRTLVRSYAPANLLFIMDSRRNMRRLMELIALFDSDAFAGERIRLFDIRNTLPSELLKDLEKVLRSISLDNHTSTVRFLPVDRIGKLIAVAPNPGVFERVEMWIRTLDIPITESNGITDTYVYRVNYGRADCLAMALNQLYYPNSNMFGGGGYGGNSYGNNGYTGGNQGNYGNQGFGNSGFSNNGYNNGGTYGNNNSNNGGTFGGNNSGYGNGNGFNSQFGGGGGCGPYAGSGGGMGGGGYGYPTFGGYAAQTPVGAATPGTVANGTQAVANALQSQPGAQDGPQPPRIVPNPLDNSLLIQANAQQYQSILKLLRELDRPPRQILLEAKIFQVVMSDGFSAGVNTLLQQKTGQERRVMGSVVNGGVSLSAGMLVGQARELLSFLSLSENASHAKVISQPSLIATDSIPAMINVGAQVPVLTGSVSNLGGASTTSFQSIGSRNTGVTLQVNARVNPSGVVTLIVNQDISRQSGNGTSSIPTPTFDQQVVQTQLTMQDGDTIAIGGIISETTSEGSVGIPGLHRIPGLGAIFGSQTRSKARTELILFMTPHVIYDTTDLLEASEQVKKSMRSLHKYIVE